jgi:AcrR family transcriptional regulator
METRAGQEAETRRRIVEATLALHGERGIVAVKPAEIAARANVALTTYYKHFPARDTLVRACTTRGSEITPPPDIATVAALPEERRAPAAVRALFGYYEAREPWLLVGHTEERLVPELQPIMERLRALRDRFVRAALPPGANSPERLAVATALLDFWTWRILRRELHLSQDDAVRTATTALYGGAPHPASPQSRTPKRTGQVPATLSKPFRRYP